ncbi:MAG: glycosyltransferase family 61 protein [Verrucomicrobiota bacterium]
MSGSWWGMLLGSDLQVEGRSHFIQRFREKESLRKTMKILDAHGYQLQFLEEYAEENPGCLLSPLTARHERFPAGAIQEILGFNPQSFRSQWDGVQSYEMRGDLVASLSEASLWGYPFFVLTQDQVLLQDCSWEMKVFRKVIDRPEVTRRIQGRAIILPLHRCRNYYHWVLEVLPRVQLLMEEELWGRIPVIVPPLQNFQMESLVALGLNPDLMIPFEPDRDHFEIEEAIYPSRVGAIRKVSPTSVEWLRKKLDPCVLNGNRKIYYSRSTSKTRRVLNEVEFIPELIRRGFEIFTGDKHSFLEQVALFAEAKVVVGAHGAGLANIAFCRPKTPVLELMARDYVNPCFGELCDSGRNPYSVLVGKPKYDGNYRVNSKLLLDWVDRIG